MPIPKRRFGGDFACSKPRWRAEQSKNDMHRVGVRKLLATGLHGEVFLRLGNRGLARIAVLGDEIAREAGEVKIGYFAFTTRPEGDHFAGAGKVIRRVVTRLPARG